MCQALWAVTITVSTLSIGWKVAMHRGADKESLAHVSCMCLSTDDKPGIITAKLVDCYLGLTLRGLL